MKKLFCIVGLLLIVTILAMWVNDIVNRNLILSSTANSAYKTYRLFIEQPHDDMPIFGSSRALLHYIPPMLSKKAFNYGFNGSAMGETLFHVKQAIQNGGETPIIINLDPWGFPKSHTTVYRFDYCLALANPTIREVLPDTQTSFIERCPGIRFHGAFRKNLAPYLNSKRASTKEIVAGASLEINSRTAEEWIKINKAITENDFYCDSFYQKELSSIYNSTSRPIILVVGPCSPGWRAKFKGEEKLCCFLEEQVKYENVYVVDLYTTTSDWTEDYFTDPTHLNKKGAICFSQILQGHLKKFQELSLFFECVR